jgi:hypothetical protein
MNIQTIELKKITATDGYVLTNGETYGKEIYLGCNDSPDNWHEITDEEYAEVLKTEESESNGNY